MKHLILLIFLTVCSLGAFAEHEKTFGDYVVHYSVLNSTFIKPDVAQHYGITRGKDKAVINIAINKQLRRQAPVAHAAKVSGSSSDLIHSVPLEFKEFKEGNAIYYIAQLKFRNKEMRTFTIKIQPEPQIAPYTLKFSKTLYTDK